MKKGLLIYTLLISLFAMSIVSCDKKNDDPSSPVIYGSSTSSALVTSFSLQANVKKLAGLDSIHFSIDQENKVIYNADSLPMGTDVSHLLCKVTFGTSVTSAEFVVGGGIAIKQDTTIKYSDTMTDSIDFTGNVTLNVKSQDGTSSMSYRVYVNVHQVDPDSIAFPLTARRDLPAAGDDNYAVGMTLVGETFYSIVNNSNGRYLATGDTPAGKWNAQHISLAFTPVEGSLTATDDALYMLDDAGNLYTSTDAQAWTPTGQVWSHILGAYGNRVLGISLVDGLVCTDEYPRRTGYVPQAVDAGFPVKGTSQFVNESSDWSVSNIGLLYGGVDQEGNVVGSVWGYDGNTWGELSHSYGSELPALEGATLFRYITYDVNRYSQHATPKVSWVVMGGRDAKGVFNRNTYISRNMGITWAKAATCMEIPAYMPSFYNAKAFVCTETLSVNKAPAHRVSQAITDWDIHYVYLVGGHDSNGTLLNNVWKGSIVRMSFKPVY